MMTTTARRGVSADEGAKKVTKARNKYGKRGKAQVGKARFDMRMPEALKSQLERAAEVSGVSATDIALRAIDEYSRRELEKWEVTRLNTAEAERFAAALSEPPRTNDRLLRAIRGRRERLVDD